jgi:hypothetical protein
MSRGGGRNGIGIQVANKLFEDVGITFTDLKKTEGGYIAKHPDGTQTLKRATVTELCRTIINSWFVLK